MYVCDIVRGNLLYNQEAIMCDKEVLKSHATKMPRIFLQKNEEVFPVLKENWVSVLHSRLLYQILLCCLQYPV
jgi:hypothetical protein